MFKTLTTLAMMATPAFVQAAPLHTGTPAAHAPATQILRVADHDAAPVELGDLSITGGFARATLPNAPVGGGFLTIANHGDTDDRLLSAEAAFAGRTEVHEMKMADGVMQMRALSDGLPIPAGGTVTLEPGGLHIMFMQLNAPLAEGEVTTVRLTFEQAGEVEVPLTIGAPNAKTPADHAGHATMGDMKHAPAKE